MPPYHSSDDVIVYVDGSRVLRRKGAGTAHELVRLDSAFSATDVALNKSGSLLAVAARKALSIWITEPGLPAQRLRIDGMQFEDYIRDMLWHPCAREDACLVVLTQHSLISVYCPPGEASIVERTRLLDAENIELDAVGLSFGSENAPAGLLTLYVATADGDIYGLCPFAPPEIELPKDRLSAMREFAPLGTWPVELDEWSETYGKVTVLKRPSREEIPLRISSEPLKLVPYPEELYDEEVLDLAVGGLSGGWASDIIVQTTTHFVNFFMSGFPMHKDLVLVSCVKFARPQKVRKVRVVTPKLAIIDTQSETHVLHIEPWVNELAKLRHKHALEPASALPVPANLPATKVESIALSYAYCTHHAVEAVPISFNAPVKAWPLREADNDSLVDTLHNLSLESSSFVRAANSRWERLADMRVAPSMPTTPLDANLAALYDLDDISSTYESKVSNLLKALVEMHFARQTQKKELLAQLEHAAAISEKVNDMKSKTSELPKTVASVAERQGQLNDRIRKLADTVAKLEEKKAAERPLCAAEERWFDELETQLSHKTAAAQSQFAGLQDSVSALQALRDSRKASAAPSSQKLTHAQIRTIKSLLQRQETLIGSLKTSLDHS